MGLMQFAAHLSSTDVAVDCSRAKCSQNPDPSCAERAEQAMSVVFILALVAPALAFVAYKVPQRRALRRLADSESSTGEHEPSDRG